MVSLVCNNIDLVAFNYLLLYLLVYRECADVEEEPSMDIWFCPRCLKEPKIEISSLYKHIKTNFFDTIKT